MKQKEEEKKERRVTRRRGRLEEDKDVDERRKIR